MDPLDDPEDELREEGFLALHNALGSVDAVGFIRLYRPGCGDYTQERTLYIGDPTLQEIRRNLEQVRQDEASGVVRSLAPSRFQNEQDLRDAGLRALRQGLGLEEARRLMRLYRDEPQPLSEERSLFEGDRMVDDMPGSHPLITNSPAGKAA